MTEYAAHHQKVGTRLDHQDRLDRLILPMLGKLKLIEVNRSHVAKLHARLSDRPVAVNRAIDLLSADLLNRAERVGESGRDHIKPCRHVRRFPEKPRERLVSAEELARLGDVLAGSTEDWRAVAAIRLLMFSGARVLEICRWSGAGSMPAAASLDCLTARPGQRIAPASTRAGRDSTNCRGSVAARLSCRAIERVGTSSACRIHGGGYASSLDSHDVRLQDLRHLVASVATASGDFSLYRRKAPGPPRRAEPPRGIRISHLILCWRSRPARRSASRK